MKKIIPLLAAVVLMAGCGQSYEEKRQWTHKQRAQLLREDSAALKIAVMPTLDCLPLFVAKSEHLFDTLGTDVRLKLFTAQMDCDTAVVGGSVEGLVTDIVRAERLRNQGFPLNYLTKTNAYWQLFSNRTARIRKVEQLDDKMVGMSRYSISHLMSDAAIDSGGLKTERVFRIQVNDVDIRLKMLVNNEIDAVVLTEPQATRARRERHTLLMDSRRMGLAPGVIAFSRKVMENKKRQKQVDIFRKGYLQAVDSLKKYGIAHYAHLMRRYMKVKEEEMDSVMTSVKFEGIIAPKAEDIKRVREWLKKQ
jgi:NitT/TauT family transport system substrate-binding protein